VPKKPLIDPNKEDEMEKQNRIEKEAEERLTKDYLYVVKLIEKQIQIQDERIEMMDGFRSQHKL
jgi:hypothetical protein